MTKPRILFMGTPEFAVPALSILTDRRFPIAGVVTQPDRPRGRGRILLPSPVKAFALARRMPVFQPQRLQDKDFLDIFRSLSPDMVVLAAFGQILPKELIDRPAMGCLNIHPSLLPKYRGAAPIHWAIINGETRTGVTIMEMAEELDAGDIILQEETVIGEEETSDQLHDRLSLLGAEMLVRAIEIAGGGSAPRTAQDDAAATYAPRIAKEDCLIRWERAVNDIVNLIRGLSSMPGAHTFLEGKKLKVFGARGETGAVGERPGTIVRREETGLAVAALNGYVHLRDVQMENRKRMAIRDFLRGHDVPYGAVLGS